LLGYFGQGIWFEAIAAIDSGRGIDLEGAVRGKVFGVGPVVDAGV
jgi:hypothetical protein